MFDNGFIALAFTDNNIQVMHQFATLNEDLSSAFETSGSITITAGIYSVTFSIGGVDSADPYQWVPINSAEISTFYDNVRALSGDQSASLTLRDFIITVPNWVDDTGDHQDWTR